VSEDILREISKKLDVLIKLIAVDVAKGRELREQVRLLDQAELAPREIARILGKTPNTVSVTLFNLRKATSEKSQESSER
jgi:DNA-binding CsgD family transcriptional regulator